MKHLRLVFLAVFFLISHLASGQVISLDVKKVFDKKYPGASQVNWSILENQKGFQVSFIDRKNHKHAIFSSESKWLQTTTIVNVKRELPGLVRLTIDETYPESVYDWMEWFESPGADYYIVGITSGTEEKEQWVLTVRKDGEIITTTHDNKSHRQ